MQLILLQKVVNLGNLGDKVDVKPGYGRNFLVPHGKAVPATAANLAEFEAKRAEYEAKAQATLAGASARPAKLADAGVTVSANASTEGKLYGSVGPREIAEAITKQLGVQVGKSEVVMGEGPLRHTGEFEVLVHLHADVESKVKVIVVPDAANSQSVNSPVERSVELAASRTLTVTPVASAICEASVRCQTRR